MSGSLRANVGKKDAKALRKQGMVPCVLYGGKEQIQFAIPQLQMSKFVVTPEAATVKIDLGERQVEAVLHDLQLHPVTDAFLHADFLEIVPGKPVTISVPVVFLGSSEGVKAGGKLTRKMRKVKVRGLAEDLPQNIEINIEKLNIGDSVRVGDLRSDKLSFLDNENMTIVSVKMSRNVEETPAATTAAPAAAAAAPAAAKTDAKAPAKK
ncbi:MAG: large subunit ribosomal protein L25 [Bacteroidetes bacterium]|nr:MAG: large subunit ribosomal protein L25 [Bacteroidota bacterium]